MRRFYPFHSGFVDPRLAMAAADCILPAMKRSQDRILTTHVGSLPTLESVEAVVQKQRALGLDLINEGEYTKGGDWLSYVEERFGGFEPRPPPAGDKPLITQGKDREAFADFYRYATERGTLFYNPGEQIKRLRPIWVCTGPVMYRGQAALENEIAVLKALVAPEDAFLTSTAPASLEVYRRNEYYKSEEEFVYAIAEAMRIEYEAIAKSGVVLQVDDAWLPALWDRIGMQMGLEAFRRRCLVRVEALNHALRNIPEDRVRYHLCWGSWHGPHAYDLELKLIADLLLKVKAGAYLIEAANARHEHEYAVWEEVKLPAGKILIPGVVTHSTDVVEHPELVSQRIQRFAKRVGRDNVIAGADCGFGGRSHPQLAWAKLKSLAEGAQLASRALF
jgi:5-methyltetrahydropteroyltriglutamate--homocysteine methyltransferase